MNDLGNFLSNDILWLKCRPCAIKIFFLLVVFGAEMASLIDMLFNHCIILLSETVHLESKKFE